MTSIRKFSFSKKSLFVSRVHLFAFLIVCITLSSLFVGGATAATYSGTCGDNLTWTLTTETGVLEIVGSGDMADYNNAYTELPGWYQYGYYIKAVSLSFGVTSIGNNAFRECHFLTSIDIPDSVTSIGEYAFNGCMSLTSIDIPDIVTSIGKYAFNGCTSLTSIDIPDSVTSIGEYAFNGCSNLTSIDIPDNVTSIGEYAFNGCSNLTSITIPAGVTSIGSGAFSFCRSLTSIDIPDSVTSIGEYAFNYCKSLTSIDIPDSVTSVGEYAFNGCTSLTSVSLPNNITTIEGSVFGGCSSLTSIVIPESVTSIEPDAFACCRSLTLIVIPESVTFIGSGAFQECRSLTSIVIPESVTVIEGMTFSECRSLTSIDIPDSVTFIGGGAFQGCTSLTSIDIPDSVTFIGRGAFQGCFSLASIVIPDSVTSIGEYAFFYCRSLTSIDIPDSVTSIDHRLFLDCTSLTSVTIGNNVTSIGDATFAHCFSLTSIVIPDSVTSIGYSAFFYCNSLTSITIPAGVTSIERGAFYNCSNLEVVDLSNSIALSSVGDCAFGNNSLTAMKSGSVIYVSDKRTAALFIDGTNYYAPNTSIIVNGTISEITYIIQYNANGGTGSMADQTFTYNQTQNLSSNTFIKNAGVFSGWATTAAGPVIYTDGQSVRNLLNSNNSTLILYAVWTPGETPVTPDFSLPLTMGWNFISVPKTLNASKNTAGSLFGSVDTSGKNILGYNTQSKMWTPLTAADIIQPLNGYWIYAAAGTTINLTYPSTPTLPAVKTLYPGWNAVGLSSGENTTADNALACLGSSWKTVIPWDLADESYDTVIINGGSGANGPDRLMTLGNGYWLYVDSQSTLTGLTA